jgi:fatty acid desaturase
MNKIADQNITQDEMEPLTRRNDGAALIHIGLHFLLIALVAGLLQSSTSLWLRVIFTVVLGILLTSLFAPLHESIHKTAFKTNWMNYVTGWICGFILLLPPAYFRAFHMAHHRHTQIMGKDPELATPKPQSLWGYIWLLSGLTYWKEQISFFLGYVFGERQGNFVSKAKLGGIRLEAGIYLVAYVSLFAVSMQIRSDHLLFLWIIPVLVGQPFLRAFLLAEHTLCPLVPEMLKNTRTTITNPVLRWLCWNMNYHVEHHAYPAVPFHQLPKTHEYIRDQIQYLDSGYLQVNAKIIRAL